MEMELDGRTQAPVRFTVRVPPSASERSYHCAIGFRTLPEVTPESGTAMCNGLRY